jgi:hypothetical protein
MVAGDKSPAMVDQSKEEGQDSNLPCPSQAILFKSVVTY